MLLAAALGMNGLAVPTWAATDGTLILQIDERAGAGYTVLFDGNPATESGTSAGTYTGLVSDPSQVPVQIELGGAAVWSGTLDLSSNSTLKLYHFGGGLKTEPQTFWKDQTGAVQGRDYVLNGNTSIQIITELGLAWLVQQPDLSDYTITLENDLDMSAHKWTSISQNIQFSGSFDGKGHTVSGLMQRAEGGGFFQAVSAAGTDGDKFHLGGITRVILFRIRYFPACGQKCHCGNEGSPLYKLRGRFRFIWGVISILR
jgi:hypothetical protein